MTTIRIIEDASLEAGTATLSRATWAYVEKLKGGSGFFQKGPDIVVGDVLQGSQFLIRLVAEEHPDCLLCVSKRVKQTFYPNTSEITL
jgi:hypothetical protein